MSGSVLALEKTLPFLLGNETKALAGIAGKEWTLCYLVCGVRAEGLPASKGRSPMRKKEEKENVTWNIEQIARIFPDVVEEIGGVYHLNWDRLAKKLGFTGNREEYGLSWIGKKEALEEASLPAEKILYPVREESVNWETTKNVYIEGDNLEVLKLLEDNYANAVKLIYIDPPYNTGNRFLYPDRLHPSEKQQAESKKRKGDPSLSHSLWCSMMFPRLQLARRLLKENGVLFMSIDDHEVDNLKKMGNEIFGEENFVAQIPWQSRQSIQNDTDLSMSHEYLLVFAKNRRVKNRRLKEGNARTWFDMDGFAFLPLVLDASRFENPDQDPRGPWKADPFDAPNIRPNLTYGIINPKTKEEFYPPKGRCWRTDEKAYASLLADNRIYFGKKGTARPKLKVFYEEKKFYGSIDNSWWTGDTCGTSTQATKELMELFEGTLPFDTPKPLKLLAKIISSVSLPQKEDIILDFFSGAATTAHAVMELNAKEEGNRRFIVVQNEEPCNVASKAYKKGYPHISSVGKERIRRAGRRILEDKESYKAPDVGFRVFKVKERAALLEGDTRLALFFSLLVQVGLPLCVSYQTLKGLDSFYVKDHSVVLCVVKRFSKELLEALAKIHPQRVVFSSLCFEGEGMNPVLLEELVYRLPHIGVTIL